MEYAAARQAIARAVTATECEYVTLDTALSRVTATGLASKVPQPEFRQSLRDGFVLAGHDGDDGSGETVFPVAGMIQAGISKPQSLASGQACRIMTGGLVPTNGVRVIPQEDCAEAGGLLHVPVRALGRGNTFIQEQGSEIGIGEVVVHAGTILQPEHISLLAAVGCEEIEVYRRPRAGFLCTGSELVDTPRELHPGLKVSSNRHLLDGLIRRHGADPAYLGTISDSTRALEAVFQRLLAGRYDLVISTGGMGPGKYDLIEQSFIEAGGMLIYNSLDLRPGKASLCGILGRTLFFGLPGPPMAVRALLNAIVGPALLRMQGVTGTFPPAIRAYLQHPLRMKRSGVMQLRGGITTVEDGRCLVREAGRLEPSSCYLLIAADKADYEAGELIDVQLIANPFSPGSI